MLRGHSEFIGYGQHAFAFGRMARALDRRIVSETRLGRLENINAVVKTANQTVFTVVIAWVGLSQMLSGRLTIGQVFGFLTMSGYFLGSMDSVASLQVTAQRTSAALGRYRDVILQRDDARRGLSEDEAQTPLEPADLRVTVLRFTHEGSGRAALSGVSLIVPHGTSVLLRGANGSGKSTLLGLLGGIHQGYQAVITLGAPRYVEFTRPTCADASSTFPRIPSWSTPRCVTTSRSVSPGPRKTSSKRAVWRAFSTCSKPSL